MTACKRGDGLLFPSTVTGILRTITRTMIERLLGSMPGADMTGVDRQLQRALGLEAERHAQET